MQKESVLGPRVAIVPVRPAAVRLAAVPAQLGDRDRSAAILDLGIPIDEVDGLHLLTGQAESHQRVAEEHPLAAGGTGYRSHGLQDLVRIADEIPGVARPNGRVDWHETTDPLVGCEDVAATVAVTHRQDIIGIQQTHRGGIPFGEAAGVNDQQRVRTYVLGRPFEQPLADHVGQAQVGQMPAQPLLGCMNLNVLVQGGSHLLQVERAGPADSFDGVDDESVPRLTQPVRQRTGECCNALPGCQLAIDAHATPNCGPTRGKVKAEEG